MKGYHIHITGRVQGVGFRPFVYKLITKYNIDGWVGNFQDGVHIEIKSSPNINEICNRILGEAPDQAIIENLTLTEVIIDNINGFSIVESLSTGDTELQITPDFAICNDCREELKDSRNFRYNYPFITCTNCGPRYSIIKNVPYDRIQTTMEPFQMCISCSEEFNDPVNRRFFSQTNSCPDCSIQLWLYNNKKQKLDLDQDQIFECVNKSIISNKIVAVKGIGGYLLLANATSKKAISKLRERKYRPSKPFALMYPNRQMAAKDVVIDKGIESEWESPESPIVLCKLKSDYSSGIIPDLIAPGLNRVGVMMPYAPLLMMLMDKLDTPIIATSGNISGSPIIYEDDEALEAFKKIADLILVNNRRIVVSQDDSVIKYSSIHKKKIILRRSRGLAPSFQNLIETNINFRILAMGAMLKSAFGINHLGRIYISQFLGNTETLESQYSFDKCLDHMIQLLGFTPSTVLIDMHPDYPSSSKGLFYAQKFSAELLRIQHHEAHSYAVLGENNLLSKKNILSIVWDGTGYGRDGQIWGGEIFDYNGLNNIRIGHWDYFPHILGDKMILEPRISALCVSHQIVDSIPELKTKFDHYEWINYNNLLNNVKLYSSSVGRIFDAVVSLLGISDINSYEGESAMYLESIAEEYFLKNYTFSKYYDVGISENGIISTSDLLSGILVDILNKKENGYIALKFHISLVVIIQKIADSRNFKSISFSGGVFQNSMLVDLIINNLSEQYNLYFHKQLSPNDECIPYGQLMAYQQSC